MFARKKPARPDETSTPTPAPSDALAEVTTLTPEPAAPVEISAPTPAEAAAEAPPSPEPAPVAARPAPAPTPVSSARPLAPAARPKAVSFLAGDLAFTGTLSGAGDVHLGGPFEGDIRVRDVTVGAGGRVDGTITGRRIEVLGRVRGGLAADEVRVRAKAEVDGDVTTESFTLETGARFEGRSKRKAR